MNLVVIDPATGLAVGSYAVMSEGEVDGILTRVAAAQTAWRRTDFTHRAALMREAARLLDERSEKYGRLMAREMGKPLDQGVAETEKCAWVCRFFADEAEGFLADEAIESDAFESFVTYNPLGVVLAVMPWNFPFWQVFRFAAPNLMAGNGGLLKHASNVPGCALAIEEVFRDAGFPEHLFRTLLVGSDRVEGLIQDHRIQAATLTGSTPAGRAVARAAGEHLKKTVLELGGSDPYLVLEDADLDLAVETCVTGRLINSGQSCIAAKRFLVVAPIRERFEQAFVQAMRAKTMGEPLKEGVDLGPLAREDLRDELHAQVEESIQLGARLLLGGQVPDRSGAFYPPTVLTDVGPGMPAYRDELFGPVASIIPVADEGEAVRVANDTSFGLGGAVFTKDLERGRRIATEELEAGCCFVNAFVRSDPRLPFGGIKESGYGRELSRWGIHEFVNAKTVYIK